MAIFIAPTTSEAEVIDEAIKMRQYYLPVNAPTVACIVTPDVLESRTTSDAFVVYISKDEVVAVVAGFVNPGIFN